MTGVLNVPNDDRFMVITEHDQADLVISPEYLGIGHTADVVLIIWPVGGPGCGMERSKAPITDACGLPVHHCLTLATFLPKSS